MVCFFAGCVCYMKKAPFHVWVLRASTMEEPMGSDEILKLPKGIPISFDQLLDHLQTARVIFIGESHNQTEHHRIEVRILQGLLERGKKLVLAMEMFERSRQPVLDRWSQGFLNEEEFLRQVKWDATWGMDYGLYRSLLDEARDHHLKVLALNLPKDIVRKVAQKGLEKLLPEEKKALPEMDLGNRGHRAYIRSFFKSHPDGSAEDFEHFYEAQCLWDEGMAERLSAFLQSPEAEGETVLVVAGGGHIVFNFGIPCRLYRRNPVPLQTLVLRTWERSFEENVNVSGTVSPIADFVWITQPNPPEKKRPRIGVILKSNGEKDVLTGVRPGVQIDRVLPRSPAEKAGLLQGDRFLSVEGTDIRDVEDIHQALDQKGWGKEITFTISRQGLKQEVTVRLPPSEDD
jgi:uncharacterized iron-regulated protein